MKTIRKKLLSKVASKKALKKSERAIKSYDFYKETSDLIERVDKALGRKAAFRAATGSTLNFEVDQHGVASTSSKKI